MLLSVKMVGIEDGNWPASMIQTTMLEDIVRFQDILSQWHKVSSKNRFAPHPLNEGFITSYPNLPSSYLT